MRQQLVIVADDLTGAGDTGVQFSRSGLLVKVIIGMDHLREELERCDVLVVDLESRMDDREEAYRKHFALGSALREMGKFHVYKKLDSTLRGNIGAEIDGLMDALQLGVTLLAPALPGSGRSVIGGEVYVRGVRLADTEFADDPRTPVRHSSIAAIIGQQSERVCRPIPTEVFNIGVDGASDYISEKVGYDPGIFVFDSHEEQDLENIAGMVERLAHQSFLVAGSSGLARHLGRTAYGKKGQAGADRRRVHKDEWANVHGLRHQLRKFYGGPVFVFAGSVSGRSQDQVRYAVEKGNCVLVFIGAQDILAGEVAAEIVASVHDQISKGHRRFIFTAAMTRGDVVAQAEKIAAGIGMLASGLIRKFRPAGILLTGGETAIHTVQALGATGIHIVNEVLPGVQYGYLSGLTEEDVVDSIVVTKAGGFGEEDAILQILEFLTYE